MFRLTAAVTAMVAVGSAANAQSFECAKASTPTEHLICSVPAFGELDATMAGLYKKALDRNPARVVEIRQNQTAWWRRREACGYNAACVEAAEKDRIAQLETVLPDGNEAASSSPSAAFLSGQTDRQAWETWSNGLTGDTKAGAIFWAGQRNQPHPGSCYGPGGTDLGGWTSGCVAAQQHLSVPDVRRRTEPDYKVGWNAYQFPLPQIAIETPEQHAPAVVAREAVTPDASIAVSDQVAPRPTVTSPSPPAAQDVGGGGGGGVALIVVIVVIAAIVAAVTVPILIGHRDRVRYREALNRALNLSRDEINKQGDNLKIRRSQTITLDIYGTKDYSRWQKEMSGFINSRISPILSANGLESFLEAIQGVIVQDIETIAQMPRDDRSEVARYVSDPFVFDERMSPLDYERHCAILLENGGWTTRLTPATGDQGADVVAERHGIRMVVQCKLYSQPVGNKAVQEVFSAKNFQGCDVAAVVSNAAYTPSARQLAATTGVWLLHHDQLGTFNPDIKGGGSRPVLGSSMVSER